MWRWREGRDEVEHTWATVAKLMAKYPDMHFAASSAQYYVWLEQRDPKLLARIQALAREGRWHPVGGWWVESDANIPSGESLVRQALYGQRTYMRLFGHPSRVAWLPNTFGFAWSLPQILRQSGFDYFVTEEMRWNDTNRWPAKLNTFWWEGPDGSRIFVDMLYAYDHDLTPHRLAKEFDITRDSSASPRMLTVYGVGDHGGGPTMAMLLPVPSIDGVAFHSGSTLSRAGQAATTSSQVGGSISSRLRCELRTKPGCSSRRRMTSRTAQTRSSLVGQASSLSSRARGT